MLDPHKALTTATPPADSTEADKEAGGLMMGNQERAEGATADESYELNLNCSYDFRPTNFNFLLLSRFSFATKRRRIQKLIRKKTLAKKAQLMRSLNRVEDLENRGIESRQRQTKIENKTLETIYPKLYRDYIEARVKRDELLHDQGLDLGRTGTAEFEYVPQHLDPQKALKCSVTPSLGTLTAEIPEDVIRAKASFVSVPQPRYNQYTNRPI